MNPNNPQAEPTSSQPNFMPDIPAELETRHQNGSLRKLGAYVLLALTVAGGAKGFDGVPEAFAANAVQTAVTPRPLESNAVNTAVVPDVRGDTLAEARKEASQAGLKVVGAVNIGEDRHLNSGEAKVATGLEIRATATKKDHGKLKKRTLWSVVRPGRHVKKSSLFRTRYKIRPVATSPPSKGQPLGGIVRPPDGAPATTPPIETPPLPEFDFAAESNKYIWEHAGVFPAIDFCSISVIDDSNGKPVAAASATHCVDPAKLQTDAHGAQTLVTDQPLVIKSGSAEAQFVDVANVDRVLVASGLSPSGDAYDLLLTPFNGVSDQEAIDAYKSTLITDEGFKNLPRGTVVKSIGYPLNLPDHETDPRTAQLLEGKIIAKVNISTPQYSKLPVVMAGYLPNEKGFVCAPGASGMGGLVFQIGINPDGTKKLLASNLGVLSGIDEFRRPPLNVFSQRDPVYANSDIFTERKKQFGFTNELDPYKNGVVCYFDNRAPEKWKTITLKSTYTAFQGLNIRPAAPPSNTLQAQKTIDNNRVLGGTRAN